jgi:hypothetical protein
MALSEGIAILHQNPDIALQVMNQWYGFEDREYALAFYSRGAWIPKKPYPCYEGLESIKEIYDSHEMRQLIPTSFYNDTILRSLDQSGFIDGLYR